MKKDSIFSHAWPAAVFLCFFSALFGVLYPCLITLINQLLFPKQSNGSLIYIDDQLKGSHLIGQMFVANRYFWSRPSHTPVFPYNSAFSSGSNLGTTNPSFIHTIEQRIKSLKGADISHGKTIPIDLICASGSGLDPHISHAAAQYQIARIAKARGINEQTLRNLIDKYAEKRQFGVFGEPRINVVKLNIELDKMS